MSALKLAQSLIKIKSISPNDEGCFDLIEKELIPLGFQIDRIPELNCETLLAKYGNTGKVFSPSMFELSVIFDFSIYRRNNRGLYKRLQIDNYY